jgi:outer membrane receptor protein involved in Fe transport
MHLGTHPRPPSVSAQARPVLLALAVLAVLGPVRAQQSAAATQSSPAASPGESDVIALSPFQIDASRDRGYVATQSLVATGFGQDIFKTPINITVITSEFMKDLALTSLDSTADYLSGVSRQGNSMINAGDGAQFLVRSFRAPYYTRNGVRRYVTASGLENVDRVEAIKGPVSVFFGQQAPGGIVNYVTKRPNFRESGEVFVKVGSDNEKYASFAKQGAINDQFAYRVYGSRTDSEGWRDFTFEKRDFLYGGLLFRPSSKLQVYLEYEYTRSEANLGGYLPEGNPQFLLDWSNPPANVRTWAVANNVGSNPDNTLASAPNVTATGANVVDVLRDRWRRSIGSWQNDIQAATGTRPDSITGPMYQIYPQGTRLNVGGPGGITNNEVVSYMGEINYRINDIFSVRGFGVKDDVDRWGFTSWNNQPNGDGTLFSAPTGNFDLNRSQLLRAEVLSEFAIRDTTHRVIVGTEAYRDDFYGQGSWRGGPDAFTVPTNQIPSEQGFLAPPGQSPVRPTTLTGYTDRGWDPRAGRFVNAANYFANGVLPRFSEGQFMQYDRNYRDSLYGSWAGTYLDGRLTSLLGVRKEEIGGRTVFRDGRNPSVGIPTEATIPTFGAVYEFRRGFVAFASYSESFERNFTGRVSGPGTTEAERLEFNEPNRGEGFDIGLKASTPDGKISGALTFYRAERAEGYIRDTALEQADPRNRNATAADDVQIRRFGGTVRSSGVEFDGVFNPSPNYTFTVSYSYMPEAEITSPSSPSDAARVGLRVKAPKNEYSTWHRYTFTQESLKGLTIGAGLRGESDKPKGNDPSQRNLIIKGELLFDAMVRYELRGFRGLPMSLSLNVSNVFDKEYIIDWSNEVGLLPGDPRRFSLSLVTRF